jgi:4-amino-4-deoxy-L-arabinose transferase-like glycosyltransferase
MLYWAACAVLLPVTTWDSQVYNLARLLIAEKAGFWSNPHWFSERQVIFPWAFDAVHYPFVKLGFGEAVPSFLCFVGLLIIVYKILRDRYSSQLALFVCLGLVSMPTMVYQATSTKNDLVVVFLVGCWFYSLFRYRLERAAWLLAACGLSLGFLAGAKTSGIFFAILLLPVTLVIIRRYKAKLYPFLASLIVSVLLFGSVETYVLSYFRYGHPLGPRALVKMLSNRDGTGGAMANFVRYYIGNISLGVYSDYGRSTLPGQLETLARYSLATLNLRDAGYRSDLNDSNLQFLKTGTDDSSDFGIFGWLAFTTCLLIPFFAPLCSAAWLTAIVGLCSLAVICYTIGWTPWNTRFLVLPYSLFAIAALIFVFGRYELCKPPYAGFLLPASWSRSLPLHSSLNFGNRKTWFEACEKGKS